MFFAGGPKETAMTDNSINIQEPGTCVYDVYMGDEIVYVGIADCPKNRWASHRQKNRFPKSAKFKIYNWYDTRHEAMLVEGSRQRELLPRMCRKIEGGAPDGHRVRPWSDNMHHIRRLIREEGRTFKAVGERYDVTAQTVSRHLNRFEADYNHLFNRKKDSQLELEANPLIEIPRSITTYEQFADWANTPMNTKEKM